MLLVPVSVPVPDFCTKLSDCHTRTLSQIAECLNLFVLLEQALSSIVSDSSRP